MGLHPVLHADWLKKISLNREKGMTTAGFTTKERRANTHQT